MDKVLCSNELVRILVDAYPEGAAEEDDAGYTPLACALRWEHSDTVLKMMLKHNRFEQRGLYFVVRYGVLLGSLLYCADYAVHRSGGRKRSRSVSYVPSKPHSAKVQGRHSFGDVTCRAHCAETVHRHVP